MRIKTLITSLLDWFVEVGVKRSDRPWCTLGYTGKINRADIAKFFSRTELIADHKKNYGELNPLKKADYTYTQAEIDLIYGFQKGFVLRNKTRLQVYRDDASQKVIHTRRAVQSGLNQLTTRQTGKEIV